MKRYLAVFLVVALLLSGSIAFAQTTGNEIYDNAPDLTDDVDAFFDYFKAWEGFQQLPDFIDERTPYEDRLAAEEEAIGLDFYDLYNLQAPIIDAFSRLVDKNVDVHNDSAGLDDMLILIFMPAYSMELAMGASLTEKNDWGMVSNGISQAFGMFGGTDVQVVRNAAHDYTITYMDEGKQIVDYFKAIPNKGIQMLSYTDGELTDLFEFICLEDNFYVWQTRTERILIAWDGTMVQEAYYSSLSEGEACFGEGASIFGTETVIDEKWVNEREEYHTRVWCDGESISVTAVNFFFGGVGHAEVSPLVR